MMSTHMARTSRFDFWRNLTPLARAKLSTAIFFTFSTIGIFQDFWAPGAPPWPVLTLQCIIAGGIALSWAYTFMWSKKFVIAIVLTTVASSLLGPMSSFNFPDSRIGSMDAWRARAAYEAAACCLMVIIGYIFFVRFVGTEGAEQLRLKTEVNLAQQIHEVLVPPVDQSFGRVEVFGRSSASAEVGGDLLDVFSGEHGVVVTVADVSGHGVAAGTMMGMMKAAARVKLMDGVKLDVLVHDLNRVLFQVKGDGMFMTIAALRFHPEGSVEVAVAGHLPVLRIRAGSGEVELLPNEQLPLGIVEDTLFWSRTVTGERGDVFVLLTDGLTEVENAKGEELGWEPLRDIVVARRNGPLSEIHNAVMQKVTAHGKQEDDQTLALIRLN
ncbi:MAG TPA: PP2C family protein-serine/threonine phosphatase [Xanthobacteraceae bacterium]|nr:PP2C family protein-serine/threonine phosphatase [Xanthobacteraceae bacterium]